ncbi:hypothetical protein DAPPUDRAFT_106131 [Daphnia pulex]|uniref:Plasmodium RESA N-terminal domain-containing protein n=1 Tax=Daphnia pulex TaxID=6669 RepID=E9GSU9_DAPPU|nr:hypothetical protein DAPPUDRAFT_106131 [Daphnia pulex]|eukprot:EFX77493.1 hypothetical protein DAPPUDRAFT_106131 [Daphnia pulex]
MKLPISLFIFQNAVFLLFFNDSFCAPSQTSGKRIKHQISVETGVENSYTRNGDSILTNEENFYDMEQLIRDLELRDKQSNDLVQEFKNLGDYFTNSVDSTKPNQNILFEVKAVWQRIVDSNLSEFADYFTNLEFMASQMYRQKHLIHRTRDRSYSMIRCTLDDCGNLINGRKLD